MYTHALLLIETLQLVTPVPLLHASQVSTKQVPVDIVLFELFHTGVFQVAKWLIAEQFVVQLLLPVPVLYLPAAHAVQLVAPTPLYDPVTHAVATPPLQ